MFIHIILCLSVIFLLFSTDAMGQGCPGGYKSLKRIEAQCQVGCSYRDYNQILGLAKTEINLCPQKSTLQLQAVLIDYETVNDLWQWKLNVYKAGQMPANHEVVKKVLEVYPHTEAAIDKGEKMSFFNVDAATKIILDEASKKLSRIKK